MLNHRTIKRVNSQTQNPLVIQAIFYDLDEQTGFVLDKKIGKFECLCPFCLGFTLQMTNSHFIQQPNFNAQRPQTT